MTGNHNGLKIIIVGSGLAGLTAARILREHHSVTVYERGDASVATGGQGIIIAPNGVKILESVGYDRDRAGAVPICGIRTYDKECHVQEDVDMNLKSRFGADCLAQKRSDFRDELLRLTTADSSELGIGGHPAKIVFRTEVVGLDANDGVVALSDGTKAVGDVVVIADGVHSRLRNIVLDSDTYAAKKTGLTCYRVAVSTEDARTALGDLPLPHWWEPFTCQNRSSLISDGAGRVVTAYPIRHHKMFNLSCILRTQESTKRTTESWNANGDKEEMLRAFSDFNEPLKRILSAATEVKVWELQDLESLPTWVRSRAILIGDAAHAMTPMQGQGANMSIEDAESFRLLLPGTSREDVPDILGRAEGLRRMRVKRIQEETRKAHSGGGLAERVNNNSDLYYGYRGIHEALKADQNQK